MVLKRLRLTNFRNYTKADVAFSSSMNIIYGLNAQGKTNFLEAIYLLCLGRSFRLARNQDLIKGEEDFFLLEGEFILDNGIDKKVVLNYIRDRRKEISVNRKKIRGHSEIFGHFPVVVMAPDEFKITSGGPAERRRFLDILLSQVSLSYLVNLQEYSRTLKQRNKILQCLRDGKNVSSSAMEPWSDKLVDVGSKIIVSRRKFIEDFSSLLTDIYQNFSRTKDKLTVHLQSKISFSDGEKLKRNFEVELLKNKEREKIFGSTLVGPHRDDVIFQINGMDLRRFGSRGEHKSVLISIKIAEFHYIQERRKEVPLLLLDDCYSELDEFREEQVFDSLQNLGQICLTTPKVDSAPDNEFLKKLFKNHSQIYIEGGNVVCQN